LPVEDLGGGAVALVSLSSGEAKALSTLAELAVGQVPGCAAAHVTLWRDGEVAALAATHPDAAELAGVDILAGPQAAAKRGPAVHCADTLTDDRWPEWTAAALRRGVRCCVFLAREFPPMTLVLALLGVQPHALDQDCVPAGEALVRIGGAALGNALAYGAAQRTATQLQDSVAARAVTDRAVGILMHAFGCDVDAALARLRAESQRQHVKVTEIAARVIAAQAAGDPVRKRS
jgi:hypothetical protein